MHLSDFTHRAIEITNKLNNKNKNKTKKQSLTKVHVWKLDLDAS